MQIRVTRRPLGWLVCLLTWLSTPHGRVDAYSSGAPNTRQVCTSLTPGHGSRQHSPSPYKLILVDIDGQVGLNLVATSQVTFAGFVLQARDLANLDQIVDGQFAESTQTKVKGCLSGKSNTWTHESGQPKTQVSTIWIPPARFNGSVVFVATVVQVKQAWWNQIKSEPVYVLNGAPVDESQYLASYSLPVNPNPSDKLQLASIQMNYDQCDRKVCIGLAEEANCVSQASCRALLTATRNLQGENEFTITAKPIDDYKSKYYSVAFSKDSLMGEDLVVDCYVESNGHVKLGLSYNTGKSNDPISIAGVLVEPEAQYQNGIVQCKWKLKSSPIEVKGKEFDLGARKYFIFLAMGELENDNGYKSYHDLKTRSSQLVSLAGAGQLEVKDMSYLVRIHGSFMVIAWFGSVSVAMILARYFKDAWNNSLMCGVKIWFALHRGLMIFSICLMVIAQICIFYYVGGYRLGLHQILGSIAFTLALFQPIGALFRPHPDAWNRWIFNWLHWLGGNVAHILAGAAILVSSKLKVINLPESFLYVAVCWVLCHVMLHLTFQFYSVLANKPRTTDIALHDMRNGSTYHEKEVTLSKGNFRYILLILYVTLLAILVTILVLSILAPKLVKDRLLFL